MQIKGGSEHKQIQDDDCQAKCKSQVWSKGDNGLKVSFPVLRNMGGVGVGEEQEGISGSVEQK